MTLLTKLLQIAFVGLILFIATSCSSPNAGANSGGKHKVWVPSDTGSHLGGRWVEVGETGSAGTGASNVQTGSAEDLRRQQLQAAPPATGR